ncbi:MAG: PQ-loop repeat-containing protein [Ilumatobacteraceae bacterium]|nr:PQ-loop repeat-containing protein [Ilumatobacteraceae bacterium]
MALTTILGAWCLIVSLSFIWPQVWRVFNENSTHGLSTVGNLYSLIGSILWLAYGVFKHRPPIYISNFSFLVAGTLICWQLVHHKKMKRLHIVTAYALGIFLALGAHSISVAAVGWLAIVVSTSGIMPQTIHVINTHSLHGISVVSYRITLTSSISWLIFGITVHDPIVALPSLIIGPCVAYILIKAQRWHASDRSTTANA